MRTRPDLTRGASSTDAPALVRVAFWLLLAQAVVGLCILGTNLGPAITDPEVGGLFRVGYMVLGLVTGIPVAGVGVVFAFLIRRGFGWARYASLLTNALNIPAAIAGATLLGYAPLAASTVAVVLLWLPVPDSYFRSRRADRIHRDTGGA